MWVAALGIVPARGCYPTIDLAFRPSVERSFTNVNAQVRNSTQFKPSSAGWTILHGPERAGITALSHQIPTSSGFACGLKGRNQVQDYIVIPATKYPRSPKLHREGTPQVVPKLAVRRPCSKGVGSVIRSSSTGVVMGGQLQRGMDSTNNFALPEWVSWWCQTRCTCKSCRAGGLSAQYLTLEKVNLRQKGFYIQSGMLYVLELHAEGSGKHGDVAGLQIPDLAAYCCLAGACRASSLVHFPSGNTVSVADMPLQESVHLSTHRPPVSLRPATMSSATSAAHSRSSSYTSPETVE
uniref:Uncharacterized protein n=1 Tax=Spironucleus salmonicida TaxID=348837 RepID=V6LLF8_9EUKA|eukprot:EST41519.1 Hypothetical protein SS50377_18846 [Spironucleus salmonicida]